MPEVHPSAIVSAEAELASDVRIGPYCVVGAGASLAAGVVLHSHVVIEGRTTIGAGTEVYPFASLGHRPQDLKFGGEASELRIGSGNVIREHVTMNPGTAGGGLMTVVGDQCLFMVGAHVAHDCRVGNRVILANNATLAGHVTVGNGVVIGGLSAVLQYVRIGDGAMIGGMSGVEQDVIPYGLVTGERADLQGLNLVGLKRAGIERDQIRALQKAYQRIFGEGGTLVERTGEVRALAGSFDLVERLCAFLESESAHGICKPKPRDAC